MQRFETDPIGFVAPLQFPDCRFGRNQCPFIWALVGVQASNLYQHRLPVAEVSFECFVDAAPQPPVEATYLLRRGQFDV